MSIDTYQGGSNGLARYQPQQNAPAVRPRTVQRLTEWAESAQAAHQVATSLVQTSFVPEAFRGKAHEATAAILAGDEVGLSPMASLRAFDIIQGTAAPRAITHRAVVQSQGHSIWLVEGTSTRAIVRGRRAGETETQESEWTIDRARGLGLTNKHNWKAQPQAMLIARATSECCRLVASDALMGMPYSLEELVDGPLPEYEMNAPLQSESAVSEPPPASESPTPARRTAQRKSQPKTQPKSAAVATTPPDEPTGPPLPGEDDYEEIAGSEDLITDAQSKKLHALFREGNISDRDTKLQAAALIIGREVESSKDLTKVEASRLIERLEEFSREEVGLAETLVELLGRDAPEAGDPS